jgi:hypothetical protein
MRAFQLFPNGVTGKLNVFLAKETGYFQVFRFPQCDGSLAMRAGNFSTEVLNRKLDMSVGGRTGDFQGCGGLRQPTLNPKRGATADEQEGREEARYSISGSE